VLDDRVEQRPQVLARHLRIQARRADARVGIEHGKIELILVGVEIDEQVVDLVQHFGDARVGPVDLVDHDERRQPALERLSKNKAGLRQRPFRRVDQQHHPVHHRQRPLDLAAEVGVARGIDDVDQHVVVVDGGVLRENGDAALTFQFVAVHRALGHALVGAKHAALVQQRVDSVVLPWSTCAMMATLRRSGLATSMLPDRDEGFSTDRDILPVYRSREPSLPSSSR
jgi:hypothetical protein